MRTEYGLPLYKDGYLAGKVNYLYAYMYAYLTSPGNVSVRPLGHFAKLPLHLPDRPTKLTAPIAAGVPVRLFARFAIAILRYTK